MDTKHPLVYWDPAIQSTTEEKIYGGGFLRWLYRSPLGRALGFLLVWRRPFSQLYGWYNSSLWSRRKVAPFIEEFAIPMEEYEGSSESFQSFNDFFIRPFRDGQRPFIDGNELPAFAEGRYLAMESVQPGERFPVKGIEIDLHELLGEEVGAEFEGGPLMIARLCPVDYHRYHYPDAGQTLQSYTLHGQFHSVNPIALDYRPDIFLKNERRVSILETETFGKLAYVEVGATCVGRIVQTASETDSFQRGDEKGYFLFGGSTVILVGQKGKWLPEREILERSQSRLETYCRLGTPVGATI